MYAIVEIAGKQYKVQEGSILNVDKLNVDGNEVVFDKILLVATENEIKVGKPTIDNVKIKAQILDKEIKGKKIVVFKWKRRKGYRRKKGHRQKYTKIKILNIEMQ
ncbi:MAG: 50S ribosomal protein L21 [Candidatus Goldbacteria bacterium]|nr:50S ribosomal protein L21 [Candidatus Goldiibacteriota bacterium]